VKTSNVPAAPSLQLVVPLSKVPFALRTVAVIVAEVELRQLKRDQSVNVETIVQSIKRAVAKYHDLGVYAVLLLKPGTIPKTSSGKIQRHVCRANFLTGSLDGIEE